jgi:hypothetical protein
MSVLDDIRKFRPHNWVIGIWAFLATLGPGTLVLFHFRRNLFEKYDNLHWIILSISMTLPALLFNHLILLTAKNPKQPNQRYNETIFYGSVFITSVILNGAFILAYLFDLQFRQFLILAWIFEFIYLLRRKNIRAGLYKDDDPSNQPQATPPKVQ